MILWPILSASFSSIATWLASKSACHILRTQCQDYGNFSVIKPGFKLTGHTMVLLEGLTVKECESACIQKQACQSINTKSLKCNLVSKSTENPFDNVKLTAKPEWTYRTTDYREQNVGRQCQQLKPCSSTMTCTDICQCPGYKCIETLFGNFRDCKDAYNRGYKANKVYPVMNEKPSNNAIMVPCDMSTDGGGWIVFQRRVSGSVDFNLAWNAYKDGFGDPNGNFWLGLDNIHKLAAPGKGAILRVDMKHMRAGSRYEKYSKFEVDNEASGYKLKVGGASGDASDSFSGHSGVKFTTHDKDQDSYSANCATIYGGGWWYKACATANLNGKYPASEYPASPHQYISWYYLTDSWAKITFSEMKLKIP